ncbi:MAG TPA: SdrD B-like domain-containing protein [Thermoanaerobaculia bacterium]|nr:SdrD B-like domain-containing protein [Thermoanaerobaculia bacterium]
MLLALVGAGAAAAPVAAQDLSLKCLPTCSTTDGRFMAIAGTGLDTLSPPEMVFALSVPATSTSFDFGFFDGDGGEFNPPGNPLGEANWDSGLTALFEYSLYADPEGDGTGLIPVDLEPGSPTILSSDMPDNAWRDFTIATGPEAQTPSGNYFYVIKVRLVLPTIITLNAFKVRSSAVLTGLTLDPVERPFSYIATWTALSDLSIVYPNFPAPTPTTYDGSFRFFFDVPVSQTAITVWDGDFDHGKFDLTDQDTDDPDTPGLTLPPWATPETLFEGAKGTGSPPDDTSSAGSGAYILRAPSIRYELTVPGGPVLANENPSGNQEWEQFRISTDPFDAAEMDYSLPSIPPGAYKLEILGADMLNLNALLLPFRLLCVEETGEPCVPIRPFLLGDLVFRDDDGDGVQDPGEPGLAGVLLELYDAEGVLIATTTTDMDGGYSFGVESETYEVRVAASNFTSGPLAGYSSTTGGDSRTDTVDGDNVLDFDFGYRGAGSIGDRIWNDLNGDGVQDGGEAGINGVTVELLDVDANVAATTATSGDGGYSFANLGPGTYTVRVDSGTVPAGFNPTFDSDGVATPNQATVTVTAGSNLTNVDFGYRATPKISLGDRVWSDTDGDGVQDGGEAGLNGVGVQLLGSGGTVIATQTTSGNGNYSFANLDPGTYSVRIVTSTLPAGATPTFDADGTGTPHIATVTASANSSDVDFGYRPAPVCTAGYFKDHFSTASFANNDGTLSWTGSWVESDTAGPGASSGNVTVGTPVSGYMILRDSPDTGTQPSAARQANLSGFVSATLTVSFHIRGVEADDAVVIEVSSNGGSSYTPLETLTGYTGTYISSRTFDISSFIASNTRVRFRISKNYGGDDDFFKVDWVKIDAGCTPLPQTGSIGDRVWKDTDGDGSQDSSEPGLNGVTVQLLNSGGTVIATQTTSGNGNYSFSGLPAGTYRVKVVSSTLPSGSSQTHDLDGTGTAHIATVTLAAGQNRTDADFGYRPAPSCTAGYFKDHFDAASFSNNDGTLSWAGAWVESDTAGTGVSKGNVTVGKPVSGYLILRDSPDTGTQPSAARQANLSGFATATLRVSFHIRGVEADDAVVIEVSKNGGSSYTVLETLTGYTGTYISSRTFNISSYRASNTRVRFRVSKNYGGGDDFFKVDWVKIDAGCQ